MYLLTYDFLTFFVARMARLAGSMRARDNCSAAVSRIDAKPHAA